MENPWGNPLELEVFMRKFMGNQWNPWTREIATYLKIFLILLGEIYIYMLLKSQTLCHQSLVFGMPKHDHIHWRVVLGAFSYSHLPGGASKLWNVDGGDPSRSPCTAQKWSDYPLVNITIENHVNQLYKWCIFNSYVKLPEGILIWVIWGTSMLGHLHSCHVHLRSSGAPQLKHWGTPTVTPPWCSRWVTSAPPWSARTSRSCRSFGFTLWHSWTPQPLRSCRGLSCCWTHAKRCKGLGRILAARGQAWSTRILLEPIS